MELKYFADTDTLLLILSNNKVHKTNEVNENTYIDFVENGRVVSITIEHAKSQTNVMNFSYQQIFENQDIIGEKLLNRA